MTRSNIDRGLSVLWLKYLELKETGSEPSDWKLWMVEKASSRLEGNMGALGILRVKLYMGWQLWCL